MLTYRSTQKDIVFKVQFHKYKDELYARVNEKHNSPNKAVAYEIIWSDLLLSIRGLRLIIELIKNTYGVDAITQ